MHALRAAVSPPPTGAAGQQASALPEAAQRKRVDAHLRALQVALAVPGGVATSLLAASCECLTPGHYEDVVAERSLAGACGYPACGVSVAAAGRLQLTTRELVAEAKRRAEAAAAAADGAAPPLQHRQPPSQVPTNYCSRACLRASRFLAAQLSPVAPFARLADGRSYAVQLPGQQRPEETAVAAAAAAVPPQKQLAAAPAPSVDGATSLLASLTVTERQPQPVPAAGAAAPAGAAAASGPTIGRAGGIEGYVPRRMGGSSGSGGTTRAPARAAATALVPQTAPAPPTQPAPVPTTRVAAAAAQLGAINLSAQRAARQAQEERRRAALRAQRLQGTGGARALPTSPASRGAAPHAADPTLFSGASAAAASPGASNGADDEDETDGPGRNGDNDEPLPFILPRAPQQQRASALREPPARRRPAPSNAPAAVPPPSVPLPSHRRAPIDAAPAATAAARPVSLATLLAEANESSQPAVEARRRAAAAAVHAAEPLDDDCDAGGGGGGAAAAVVSDTCCGGGRGNTHTHSGKTVSATGDGAGGDHDGYTCNCCGTHAPETEVAQAAAPTTTSHVAARSDATKKTVRFNDGDTAAPATAAPAGGRQSSGASAAAASAGDDEDDDDYWRTRYGLDGETEAALGLDDDEDELDGGVGGIWLNHRPGEDGEEGEDGGGDEEQPPPSREGRAPRRGGRAPAFKPADVPASAVIGFGSIEAIGLAYSPNDEEHEEDDDEGKAGEGGAGSSSSQRRGSKKGRGGSNDDNDDDEPVPLPVASRPAAGKGGRTDGRLVDQLLSPNGAGGRGGGGGGQPLPITVPASRLTACGLGSFGLLQSCLSSWRSTDDETPAVLVGAVTSPDGLPSVAAERAAVAEAQRRHADALAAGGGGKGGGAAPDAQQPSSPAAALPPTVAPSLAAAVGRRAYVQAGLEKGAAGALAALRRHVSKAAAGGGSDGALAPLAAALALLAGGGAAASAAGAAPATPFSALLAASFGYHDPVPTLVPAQWALLAVAVAGALVDARHPAVVVSGVAAAAASTPASLPPLDLPPPPATQDGLALCAPGTLPAVAAVAGAFSSAGSGGGTPASDAVTPSQLGLLSFALLHGPEAPWPAPPKAAVVKPAGTGAPAGTAVRKQPVTAGGGGAALSAAQRDAAELEAAERDMLEAARRLAGLPGVPRLRK